MSKIYNYIIYSFSKFLSKIFIFKEVGIYNLFIKLSIGNFKYSKYGVKLINQNLIDNTYNFCLGGAYGQEFSNYLINYNKKFIFIDIGSNIGLYSCIASKNNLCRFIYAFEPIEAIYQIAKKNFSLNSVKGKIFQLGIYSKNKNKDIYFDPKHTGLSSLIKSKNKKFKKILKCNFINNKKLNKIFYNDDIYNYIIKIDVEGVEKIVLAELIKTKIFKHTSSVLIEINDIKNLEYISKKFNDNNFSLFTNFKSKLTKDYLFIKNES